MNLHSPLAFLLLALALLAPAAKAQDGQLYEDPADPNASFLRVLAPGESMQVNQVMVPVPPAGTAVQYGWKPGS